MSHLHIALWGTVLAIISPSLWLMMLKTWHRFALSTVRRLMDVVRAN